MLEIATSPAMRGKIMKHYKSNNNNKHNNCEWVALEIIEKTDNYDNN